MEELDQQRSRVAAAGGLARLLTLLLVSIVGIAILWSVTYGVSLGTGVAVVGETCVLVALAFVCAWRWTR